MARKRLLKNSPDRDSWSSQPRTWRDHLQVGEIDATIRSIDASLGSPDLRPARAAGALGLVGNALLEAGRFDEAERVFSRAVILAGNTSRLRLRLLTSVSRAQLASGYTEKAYETACQAIKLASDLHEEFSAERHSQLENARNGLPVTLGPRPPGRTQTAARLATAFLNEGEPAKSAALLALGAGGAGPRQVARLAINESRIHWQAGRSEETIQTAGRALLAAGLTSFTLSLLPLWLRARHAGGRPVTDDEIQALFATGAPTVRARAAVVVIGEWRVLDDVRWQSFAHSWLKDEGTTHPVIATDLRKQLLAANVRQGNTRQIRALTDDLTNSADLAESEWLAVARASVRAEPAADRKTRAAALIGSSRNRYGPACAGRVRHAMARDWIQTDGLSSEGLTLLRENAADTGLPAELRRRSLWILGETLARSTQHDEAARIFARIADDSGTPARFATLARLRRVESLAATGDQSALVAASAEIKSSLDSKMDPFLALDLARALQGYGSELDDLALQLYEKGRSGLLATFATRPAPAWRRKTLLQLARRETFEFHRDDRIIELWDGLGTNQQDQLWSPDDGFWEYQHLRLKALRRTLGYEAMKTACLKYLQDPATPANGFAWIASAHAQALLNQRNADESLAFYRELLEATPNHTEAETAAYWLALDGYGRGDAAACSRFADQALTLVGSRLEAQRQRYRATALRLLTSHPSATTLTEVDSRLNAEWVAVSHRQLQNDLKRLGYTYAY